jgi:hypothetical protein
MRLQFCSHHGPAALSSIMAAISCARLLDQPGKAQSDTYSLKDPLLVQKLLKSNCFITWWTNFILHTSLVTNTSYTLHTKKLRDKYCSASTTAIIYLMSCELNMITYMTSCGQISSNQQLYNKCYQIIASHCSVTVSKSK